MKILHTSDWHLGRSLYDWKRYDEFEAFLEWLIKFMADQKTDLLLISGDVFDSTTPPNRAQELYYHFLSRIRETDCRHTVVIGGNHDSPTFLDAPKNLLGALNIHVVGAATQNPEDEVFVLRDVNGAPEAIVCAVPFLRDRDIRTVEAGENPDEKSRKLMLGIENHYATIAALAEDLQDHKQRVPVIGMGHLFTRHARTVEGDGVRELYIGSIAHVDGSSISAGFDYMALGHLHMAQTAGNSEIIRYPGSPIPMGFAEAGQTKKVIVVEFRRLLPIITEYPVPCFRNLISVSGDIETASREIEELIARETEAWIEIEITSPALATDITTHFDGLTENTKLEILRIKNRNIANLAITPVSENESLDRLDDSEVFGRCLDASGINDHDERRQLENTYAEARHSMVNSDSNAD